MKKFRSKTYSDGRSQVEGYYGGKKAPTGMHDLRSCTVNYAASYSQPNQVGKEGKKKKAKSNLQPSSSSKSWIFSDPELQRKKRVAGYKVYAMESNMKEPFKKGIRWIKDTYTKVVYRWS